MRFLICFLTMIVVMSCEDTPEPATPMLEVSPLDGAVSASTTDTEIIYHHFIDNTGAIDAMVFWSLRVDDTSFPVEWIYFYCDSNQCYSDAIKDCPPSRPNLITAGETKDWQLHIKPNGLGGVYTITVDFYGDAEQETLLASYPIEVTVSR